MAYEFNKTLKKMLLAGGIGFLSALVPIIQGLEGLKPEMALLQSVAISILTGLVDYLKHKNDA